MSDREFSGLDLVPESVKGVRSFAVDKYGRLTGVHHRQVWTPGENIAVCDMSPEERGQRAHYEGMDPMTRVMQRMTSSFFGGPQARYDPYYSATIVPLDETSPGHKFDTCACGFYGYFDGSDDYHDKGRVTGVVEAYGEAVIGTRGFRAKKARILALRVKVGDDLGATEARRVERNYYGAGIAFFDTFEAMLAEYPADYSHEPSPENDPDFWNH